MKRPSWVRAAFIAGLTSIPLVALLYLGMAYAGLPFLPFDLFDWLARVLPGRIITTTIDSMVHVIQALGLGPIGVVAKSTEQAMGIALFLIGMSLIGVGIGWVIRRSTRPAVSAGCLGGLFVLALAIVLEVLRGGIAGGPTGLLWLTVLLVGWGIVVGKLLGPGVEQRAGRETAPPPVEEGLTRRGLIATAGVSVAVTLSAWGLGRFFTGQQQASGAGLPLKNLPEASSERVGGAAVQPAPGTRPAITPNADFYRIDIDTRPPVIQGKEWRLKVEGLFEKTGELSLQQIMAYPVVTETITQACISNPIGGDLIGTTRYTGARLRAVLADLELAPSAKALELHSSDGFYEFVTMSDMLDPRTLLVYGMNGTSLPTAHGFPLRIYIPNHYGMKQPKWITRMKAVDHDGRGFWVQRGWSREARPHIISIIDAVATQDVGQGRVPVGGIAWAGDRGISTVEIRVDDGPWAGAEILEPTLGPLAWVRWRYDWPIQKGRHTFRVRAADGTGAIQVGRSSGTFPEGATGYDSLTVDV